MYGGSQKEKDKHCILMHVYGIWKESADEPACRTAAEYRHRGPACGHSESGGGGGGRGTHGESTRKHTRHHLPNRAGGDLLLTHGAQPRALRQSRGVGRGGRWGGALRGRGHMYTCN